MFHRFISVIAALVLTVLAAVPALAVPLTNPIPTGGISSTGFQEGSASSCTFRTDAGQTITVGEGEVLWHFVLNQSDTNNQTLTATFQNEGTVAGVTPYKVIDAFVLHYYIITDDPDSLLSASTSGSVGNLQLSHVCHHVPPPIIPESPVPALLVVTGGLLAVWLVSRKLGSSATQTAA